MVIYSGEDHLPSVVGHGAHYTFLVDFGPKTNARSVAHKLLVAGIGVAAGSMTSDELRVNRSLKKSISVEREMGTLSRFTSEIAKEHPSIRRAFMLKPLIIFRFLVRSLLTGWRKRPNSDTEVPSNWAEDMTVRFEKLSQGLAEEIINQTKMLGGRIDMERQLHTPAYTSADPYLRIALQPSYFDVTTPEGASDGAIEVSLMLHRTGICVVTLTVDSPKVLDFKQARQFVSPSWLEFESVQISQPIIDYLSGWFTRTRRRKRWRDAEEHSGTRWSSIHRDQVSYSISVTSVFETYMRAVCTAAKVSYLSWQSFTTLSLGRPTCGCDAENFSSNHARSLVALMTKTSTSVNFREDAYPALLKNRLPIEEQALWLSPTSAILIDFNSDAPQYMQDMHRSVIATESALCQHGQLGQIDSMTTNAILRDDDLFVAQRALTSGLLEYQRDVYSEIGLRQIVDAIHQELGTHILYSRLLDRVGVMQSLVTSLYSRNQNRRSLFISASGLVLILVLLLPRLAETLRSFVQAGGYPAALIQRIDGWTGGRGATTLILYTIVIVVSVAVFVALSVRWPIRRGRGRFGYSTRGRFGIKVDLGRGNPPTDANSNEEPPGGG
ncbi:hypothetical protein [Gordonia sp. i37]|uniref:hypothetical protein n=1 Tax=Gordonia sp. i37 TaxID=1961707 RepID=UPI001119C1B0|nr:hypothetical protein [Gordonia sp. i37]